MLKIIAAFFHCFFAEICELVSISVLVGLSPLVFLFLFPEPALNKHWKILHFSSLVFSFIICRGNCSNFYWWRCHGMQCTMVKCMRDGTNVHTTGPHVMGQSLVWLCALRLCVCASLVSFFGSLFFLNIFFIYYYFFFLFFFFFCLIIILSTFLGFQGKIGT